MSTKQLNESEIKLLSKGLKYTPTPCSNKQELRKDIKEYTRKLRLAEYFNNTESDEENENTQLDLVKNKSNFNPKKGRNNILDTVCETLQNLPLDSTECISTKQNLSKEETNALKSLASDENIVIKEADKGGAVVIMDTVYYEQKIMDMLSNTEFYTEISENQDKAILQKIKKLLLKHSSTLTDKEKEFVTEFEYKESSFYGLPKVHKSKTIKEAIQKQNSEYITCEHPADLTFRPIVGGPAAPTQRLSNLLDIILKPLCQNVKSFIRDDLDFLRHLPEQVDPDAELVSLDVVNLYTNISSTLGLTALNFWIDNCRTDIDNRFTKEFLLEATDLVLKNNVFTFNGKYFHQIKGTAMGTKMAPTYATLCLGFLEESLYKKTNEEFGEEFSQTLKKNWKRYLDDCFIIWNKGDSELQRLKNILNDLDPDIKFTLEKSSTKIPFLDVLVKKENDKISTDIFYKSTDTHQYLHFGSSHPRHIKRAIPYNLARRICTIVSDEETRNQRLNELKQFLTDQHYPINLINDGIMKAKGIDRQDLINPILQNNKETKILPLVTTHNPRNPNIAPVVNHLNGVLKTDEDMARVLTKLKFINSKRQPKNLKRILCPSTINTSIKTVSKCGDIRCGTCPFLKQGSSVDFRGKQFRINSDMSCHSKNLIYTIICDGCNKFYIGETGTTLRTRIRVHKQQIKDPEYRKIKLSEHIDVCGGGQFKVFPFYKLFTESATERREKEKHFIQTLKPCLNRLL